MIGPGSVAFMAYPGRLDVVSGSPMPMEPFSSTTYVGTRPASATGYEPERFSPAKNPGRVDTTPAMRRSYGTADERATCSFASPNTTTSPGDKRSADGNISAKSYEPVAQPEAFVRMKSPPPPREPS